jgi:hypothetical protein
MKREVIAATGVWFDTDCEKFSQHGVNINDTDTETLYLSKKGAWILYLGHVSSNVSKDPWKILTKSEAIVWLMMNYHHESLMEMGMQKLVNDLEI